MTRTAILNYAHCGDENDYLLEVVSQSDSQCLIDDIVTLLQDPDKDVVGKASLFIRDLVLSAPRLGIEQTFVDAVKAAVAHQLEALVLADNWFIRNHAIYALGKIVSTASLPTLHDAFTVLRDRDPLILPALVFEIFWLENFVEKRTLTLLGNMIESPQYTTRWSALEFLLEPILEEDKAGLATRENYFAQLRSDSHPFVRAEAEHKYQVFNFRRRTDIRKSDRRRQAKQLNRREPAVTFVSISTSFLNHLSRNRMNEYSISDLEQFIVDFARNLPDSNE